MDKPALPGIDAHMGYRGFSAASQGIKKNQIPRQDPGTGQGFRPDIQGGGIPGNLYPRLPETKVHQAGTIQPPQVHPPVTVGGSQVLAGGFQHPVPSPGPGGVSPEETGGKEKKHKKKQKNGTFHGDPLTGNFAIFTTLLINSSKYDILFLSKLLWDFPQRGKKTDV
jgi:hypothetical protein